MNERIEIKIKKLHPDAVIPTQANESDAGYDMYAIDDGVPDPDGRFIEYDTGIAIQPPLGFHTKIASRSSISKYDIMLVNGEGLVDRGYLNSIRFRFRVILSTNPPIAQLPGYLPSYYIKFNPKLYKKGERIGQIKIEKTIYAKFQEVSELSSTERGMGGFGSTGQ